MIFTLIFLIFTHLIQFSFSIKPRIILDEDFIFFLQFLVYIDFFVNINTGIYQNGLIN